MFTMKSEHNLHEQYALYQLLFLFWIYQGFFNPVTLAIKFSIAVTFLSLGAPTASKAKDLMMMI